MPCVYLPCPGGPTGNAWRNLIFSFFLFTLCVFVTLPLFPPSLDNSFYLFFFFFFFFLSFPRVTPLLLCNNWVWCSVQVDWIAQLNQFKSKLHRLEFGVICFPPVCFKVVQQQLKLDYIICGGIRNYCKLFFQ